MIQNGDFESSESSVNPWVLTPSVFNIVPITLTPSSYSFNYGKYALDLNSGYYPISINQTVNTAIGTTYLLSFIVTASNDDPTFSYSSKVKSGVVSATGAQVQSFSITPDSGTNAFDVSTVQYYFVATQTSTVITLGSTTLQYYGPMIDNVKLSPVVNIFIFMSLLFSRH